MRGCSAGRGGSRDRSARPMISRSVVFVHTTEEAVGGTVRPPLSVVAAGLSC